MPTETTIILAVVGMIGLFATATVYQRSKGEQPLTNQHPLTDDVLKQIQCENPMRIYGKEAMLAAYDLGRDEQLEQAVEWFKNCNMDHSLSYDGEYGEYRGDRYLVVNAFREAMRPTQENN